MSVPSWERQSPDQTRRVLVFLGVTGFLLLAFVTVYYRMLIPFLASLLITYLAKPTVDYLERYRIYRPVISAGLITLIMAIIAFSLAKILPVLWQQVYGLIVLIPDTAGQLWQQVLPLIQVYLIDTGILSGSQLYDFIDNFDIAGEISPQVQSGIQGLWTTGISVIGGALNVVLIPLLTFFMLQEYPRISRYLWSLVPLDFRSTTEVCLEQVNLTLRSVIKGQAMVAGTLAILYVIGLSVVGLKSAVAIGVVAGICRFIPYFDIVVGGILSAVVIASDFSGWSQVVGVVLVFVVVQTIDAAFVTPRLIGERVGLHPVITIVSIIAFADWFGFWGVLFAIPLVAVVKTVWSNFMPVYRRSRFYAPTGGIMDD